MLIFYVCEPYVVYEKATCSSYFKSLSFFKENKEKTTEQCKT